MSDDTIKLNAKLPKGELNGFADGLLAEELCEQVTSGRVPTPRVAVIIYDVKKVEVDPDTGDRTAHVQIRRAQPIQRTDSRKAIENVLFDEFSMEHGPVVPHAVEMLSKKTFSDLPRDPAEIDERESREQEHMTPADELRRHLDRVHGREDSLTMTDTEAEERHRADHEGNLLPEGLEHKAGWTGWTRAELEIAAADGLDTEADLRAADDLLVPADVATLSTGPDVSEDALTREA